MPRLPLFFRSGISSSSSSSRSSRSSGSSSSSSRVVVVVVVVVVRALYVFDDPLFWLPRNRRIKKMLQNAVLRKGANLKKVQSSESGFFVFFCKS